MELALFPYDVKRIRRWFGMCTTKLPSWLCGLLPPSIRLRGQVMSMREVLRAVAILGAHREVVIHLGQTNVVDGGEHVTLQFGTLKEALALDLFADRAYLSTVGTILRTAIMLGLNLPEVEYGRIDQTRTEPFSYTELGRLVLEESKYQ